MYYNYFVKLISFSTEPVEMMGEGEYNLNVMKEISVTDAYLQLHQDVRGCQGKGEEPTGRALPDCSGLVVTSYSKSVPKDVQTLTKRNTDAYDNHMKWSEYSPAMKGFSKKKN